jgi:4-amino-4-deoxy-L-arabinose transferase-like glycosyltransferase
VITIALQVVLSALTVAGVFVLARRLFDSQRVALIAAALYAVEPLSVIYTALLLTETLFTVVVVWSLVLIVEYVRSGRVAALLGSAALLAVSTYVRPAGYFLPFGLLALFSGYAALARRWNMLPQVTLAAAAAAVVVVPWQVRNRALGFHGISAISAEYVYFYNAAAVQASRNHTSFEAAQAAMGYLNDSVYFALHPEQRAWRPGERFQFMADQGAREIRGDWVRYARIHVHGMVRVLFEPGAIALIGLYRLRPYPPSSVLLHHIVAAEGSENGLMHLLRANALAMALLLGFGVALVALYALALWGLAAEKRYRDLAAVLLVASAAYFVVVGGGPVGGSRFRHPVMPLVCVLAAAGLGRAARGRRP